MKNSIVRLIICLLIFPLMAGATWTTKRLTRNSGDSEYPAIAVDANDHIHVVWDDDTPGNNQIFYKKSTNGGATWTTKRLTWTTGDSEIPDIATDSNNDIHVVWMDDTPGNTEIFYKKSTDGGTSWTPKRLSWTTGYSEMPDIATDSNNHIHVVWDDDTPGNYEIFYKKSTDGGTSWTTKRLTWNSGTSLFPDITIDSDNNIYVVWGDYTSGNYEIYGTRSEDGGLSWGFRRLTWNAGGSQLPDLLIESSDDFHLVWSQLYSADLEICYKATTDGGETWISTRLTWNSGNSLGSVIAIDSNNHLHLVWQDDTPGNKEIFYKKRD